MPCSSINLAQNTAEVHDFGRDATAGEAVFTPD